MNAVFYTLGCKVNQYETQAMREMMQSAGYHTEEHTAAHDEPCDVIVINSCTVTAESDRKLRQLLRRCRRLHPPATIVLTGCMTQAFPDAAAKLPEADIILGNASRRALLSHINDYAAHRQRIVDITPHTQEFEPLQIHDFNERTRAFVKIQDGCNRFCSYCIIPYARGRVRSRKPDDIRAELTSLAQKGYKEVVLVGINLTAYGQDNGLTIADAVDAACAIDGIERVRLGSLEPDFMTDEVLRRLAAQPKLCPQFHIALQSGCDTTLKRMNRHYTTAEFAELCKKLRSVFPHCALTTDVMVGFPGETEEEFTHSLQFVRSIGFSRVHVFAYSRRAGTVADRMPAQVSTAVKSERSHRMIQATAADAAAYAATHLGSTVDVLLETAHKDHTIGHTDTYLTVRVSTRHRSGDIIPVTITAVDGDTLIGIDAAT